MRSLASSFLLVLAACGGDVAADPRADAAGAGPEEGERPGKPAPGEAGAQPRELQGVGTTAETAAPGEPRPSPDAEPPPGREVGPQPTAPEVPAPPPAAPDLRPEHLQKAEWDAMSEAERRAARARSARKAYER